MKKRDLSQLEIFQKLMRYCAYQDRCSADVILKMKQWEQSEVQVKEALDFLRDEGFIDDQRFAKSYVRGKFRSNKWGRIKIKEGLYSKRINVEDIEAALTELNTEEYKEQLIILLKKKQAQLKEEDPYKRKQKLALYVHSKGYELDLIWENIKELKYGEPR